MKSRSFVSSLKSAFFGIRETAKRERNFRVQLLAAIFVVLLCIVFRVSSFHFALVALAIFFVLVSELFNTAIEAVIDLVLGGKRHPLAKIAKDASAGAVLLASAFSVVVGLIVAADILGRFI